MIASAPDICILSTYVVICYKSKKLVGWVGMGDMMEKIESH